MKTSPRFLIAPTLLLALFLSLGVLGSLRADLVVVAGGGGGNSDYYRALLYDGTSGAYRTEFVAQNEGFYGALRGTTGAVYITANILGANTLFGVGAEQVPVCSPFDRHHAGALNMALGPNGDLYRQGADPAGGAEGIARFDGVTGKFLGMFARVGDGGTIQLGAMAFGGDGNLYAISDLGIVRFRGTTGAFIDVFVPLGRGGLANPAALLFAPDGNLLVASASANAVKRYHGATGDSLGDFIAAGAGGLNRPSSMTYGPDGRLYVASLNSRQVLRYDQNTGAFLNVFATTAIPPLAIAFNGAAGAETIWFDDDLPPGAQGSATGGDAWNWVSTASAGHEDAPKHGMRAHRSNGVVNGQPQHEHFFNFAQPFALNPGDVLFTYVYIPRDDSPSRITLSWNDGANWEHRAFWTLDGPPASGGDTDSMRYLGDLSGDLRGRWIRLEIPAKAVGLEGKSVRGMSFTLYGGSATWDRTGKIASVLPVVTPPPAPPANDTTAPTASLTSPAAGAALSASATLTATAADNVGVASIQFKLDGANLGSAVTTSPYTITWDTRTATNGTHRLTAVARDTAGNQATSAEVTVTITNDTSTPPPPPAGTSSSWFDDAFPAGSGTGSTGGAWNWQGGSPAPKSGAKVLAAPIAAGRHEVYFNWAPTRLNLAVGDTFFIWIYLDPTYRPREVVLSFCADNWEHRAYWGENLMRFAADGTAAQHRVGPLPAFGGWTRLEVPVSALALAGQSVQGFSITLYDGRAWFDLAGKVTAN